jgi:LPXTG-site transpeptidase (sortase) family protein
MSHMNQKDFLIIGIITLVIFTGTYAVLSIFGFVPEEFAVVEEVKEPQTERPTIQNNQENTDILLPDRVTIPEIGVDSVIQKPQSQEISVLDEALNKGAVYYPGSGTINRGNMFIFGHSTGFSVVNNQAYKTFNDLDKLSAGDEIRIESDGKTYIYKVESLVLVDESEAFVDFSKTDRRLTISTCNSFGAKQERWVVEAVFDREV